MSSPVIITIIAIAIIVSVLLVGCNKNKSSERSMEKPKISLSSECQAYLDEGPPKHMSDYVPGSLTEIVISHGAQSKALDPELAEIAMLIVMESESSDSIENIEIKTYMKKGADLVSRILKTQ